MPTKKPSLNTNEIPIYDGLELLPPYENTSLIGDIKPALVSQVIALQNIGV